MENIKQHNDETPKKKKLLDFVKKRSKEEVVVNIKTITDIPPVQEARKKFGNGNNIGAVNGALNDISSFLAYLMGLYTSKMNTPNFLMADNKFASLPSSGIGIWADSMIKLSLSTIMSGLISFSKSTIFLYIL